MNFWTKHHTQGSMAISDSASLCVFSPLLCWGWAQLPFCSCTVQWFGWDGICELLCKLRIRAGQEQTNACQKTSQTHRVFPSTQQSTKPFTSQKGPCSVLQTTLMEIMTKQVRFLVLCWQPSYKPSPALQVHLRHKGGEKKGLILSHQECFQAVKPTFERGKEKEGT